MWRNLASNVDEPMLIAAFQQTFPTHAPPIDLRVIRERDSAQSKGYAFATFASIDEATSIYEGAHSMKWCLGDRQIHVAYAAPRHAKTTTTIQPFQPPPPSDWACTRCGTQNVGQAYKCTICNIDREIAMDQAATFAASLHSTGSNPLLHTQAHHAPAASVTPIGTTSAPGVGSSGVGAAPNESLVEAISKSRVLFLSGLPITTTLDAVRDKFVPYANVVDVLFPIANDGSEQSMGLAFVQFSSDADCALCLEKVGDGCKIDDASITVTLASATHFTSAVRHRHRSWLAQSHQSDHSSSHLPAAVPARPPGLAQSFLYDMNSGYWHDSATGYYYNAATSLYYNSHNQTYSRWDPTLQQYVQTDEFGQPIHGAVVSEATLIAAQYLALKAVQAHEKLAAASTTAAPAASTTEKVLKNSTIAFAFKNQLAAKNTAQSKPAAVAPGSASASAAAATTAAASQSGTPAISPPATTSTHAPSTSSSDPPLPNFLDPTRIACLLCKRQLKSLEQLMRHEAESQLHKDNVAKWKAAQQQRLNNPTVTAPI